MGKVEYNEIEYMTSGGENGKYKMKFIYDEEERKEKVYSRIRGVNYEYRENMASIEIVSEWSGSEEVIREYEFSLNEEDMLDRVLIRGGDGEEVNRYEMEYDEYEVEIKSEEMLWETSEEYERFRRSFMDMNGDGYVDVLVSLKGHDDYEVSEYRVFLNDGVSNFSEEQSWNVYDSSGVRVKLERERVRFIELSDNEEGLVDLVYDKTGEEGVSGGVYDFDTNNGMDGFRYSVSQSVNDWGVNGDRSRVRFMDVNGDRRVDIVANESGGRSEIDHFQWREYTNRGGGFASGCSV